MKLSEKWLRKWVDPEISLDTLVAQLSMAGLEVDGVTPVAGAFCGVVVGEVKTVEPHPKADRLSLLTVSIGADPLLNIVCGAKNVTPGIRVPVATIGAKLPGGIKIKRSKLRGVESEGMVCSEVELGLAESSNGIMILPDDAPIGKDFRAYYDLDDVQLALDLTPNRGDCLSLLGVAREVAAFNHLPVKWNAYDPIAPKIEDKIKVVVEAKAACPQYVGRVIRHINQDAKTPLWMQEMLRRCGLRPIHPVVDVMNIVMLEMGQPMHAFDLDKLHGNVVVRLAKENEFLVTLDDQTLKLNVGDLLICDDKAPIALAGVMGGLDSSVTTKTTHIFLESAFFTPEALAGSARQYGLHTDAAFRFERGVDPAKQQAAIERATHYLLSIVGGAPGPVVAVTQKDHLPSPFTHVNLRLARLNTVLGMTFSKDDVMSIFARLGFDTVAKDPNTLTVKVPAYRFDIQQEVDLIEEVVRLHGYDNIPAMPLVAPLKALPSSETRITLDNLKDGLTARGYREIISYAFVDPNVQQILGAEKNAIALLNPLSGSLSQMRVSLWPGLIKTMEYNLHRQQNRFRLFEAGVCFYNEGQGDEAKTLQTPKIAGLVAGPVNPLQWGESPRPADFYDMKGDLEALLTLMGHAAKGIRFESKPHPALHTGMSAAVIIDDAVVGWMGALHPRALRQLGLQGPIFLFELDQQPIENATIPRYARLSKYPSVRRDLSFFVNQSVPYSAIQASIATVSHRHLKDMMLFDVYEGENVPIGKKSVALAVILQDDAKTLTDEVVNGLITRIIGKLEEDFDIVMREQ